MSSDQATQADFHARRKTGFGGSDAHHLFDEPPYGCSRLLGYEKLGTTPDYPVYETGPMRRGHRLEEAAAEEYSRKTGRKIRRMPFRRHKQHSFLTVHADREICSIDSRGPGILEVKVPGEWHFRKINKEGLPAAYILQLQHALLVTGRKWGSYAIFEANAWRVVYWDVERDDQICQAIVSKASQLWRLIQNRHLPVRLRPDSPQCASCPWRTSCQGSELLARVGEADGQPEQDPGVETLASQWLDTKQILTEASALHKANDKALKEAIGNRAAIRAAGHEFRFPVVESARIDTRRLRADEPDLAEKFTVRNVTRRLTSHPI